MSGAGEKAIPYVSKISKEITPLSTVSEVLDSVITDLEKAAFLLENDPVRTGEATTSFWEPGVFISTITQSGL